MFLKWNDPAVRLTGRWSRNNESCAIATANGSYFEFAFKGAQAKMCFDTELNGQPLPHLYIEVDSGSRAEVPLDRYLRVIANDPEKNHVVRVILKGSVEMQQRWYQPLTGRTAFLGVEVEERGELPEDNRKIIEFVGDSITEGVLIDADYAEKPAYAWDQHNRVYQDDATATYAWLTAEKLNLRPVMMGYGAVGTTRGGCGGVVRAADAYPYVFDGVPYEGEKPDYIVINHGANDRGAGAEKYLAGYAELVDVIRGKNPTAVLVALGAFCNAYADELKAFCEEYSASHDLPLYYVDGGKWVPLEPLHPLRGGHRIIADAFAPLLKDIIDKA